MLWEFQDFIFSKSISNVVDSYCFQLYNLTLPQQRPVCYDVMGQLLKAIIRLITVISNDFVSYFFV